MLQDNTHLEMDDWPMCHEYDISFLSFPELYGKNNLEAAFIDQITETLRDLGNAGIKWFSEKDETKKVM